MILQNRFESRAILNVNQQEMGALMRAYHQPDRARRLFAVRYTCLDRKGMRRYG